MRIIGDKLVVSTLTTFGSYLSDRENIAKLRELGGIICINTRKIHLEDQNDPQAWLDSFSGLNLRWEAIGIVFMYAALGEISRGTSTNFGSHGEHYMECCSSCITLANIGGSSGSLMLFLLYKRSILHAIIHGDFSKSISSTLCDPLWPLKNDEIIRKIELLEVVLAMILTQHRPSILEISRRNSRNVNFLRLPR
jgi:hypothetical protein